MREIQGKVAWITGAGTGIGRAAADSLALAGMKVVLTGRRAEPLEAAAEAIRGRGGDVAVEQLDVADPTKVREAGVRIADRFGRVDVLVNNAGVNRPQRHWRDMTEAAWYDVVDVNLNGAFYCIHAVLPGMRAQKDGLIINVASMAGKRIGYVSGVPYTAAKHGMIAMSETINLEECHNGIRSTALSPGEVATEILDRRPVPLSAEDRARMVQADDMGEVILFLCRMPKHVCINEMLVTPTWNRGYIGGADLLPPRD